MVAAGVSRQLQGSNCRSNPTLRVTNAEMGHGRQWAGPPADFKGPLISTSASGTFSRVANCPPGHPSDNPKAQPFAQRGQGAADVAAAEDIERIGREVRLDVDFDVAAAHAGIAARCE